MTFIIQNKQKPVLVKTFVEKVRLILYSQVGNSTIHLTLTYISDAGTGGGPGGPLAPQHFAD